VGYKWAFVFNALSFAFSAWAISNLRTPKGALRVERKDLTEAEVLRPWHEYGEGLRYMGSVPLVLAIVLLSVGWATGGGAAQAMRHVGAEGADFGANRFRQQTLL
jgi:hypothetical protein